MKNRVVGFFLVMAVGVMTSLMWQSMYSDGPGVSGFNFPANRQAKLLYLYAREYFSESEENITGVFTGQITDSDPIGKYFYDEYTGGGYYYYLMVKDSAVVQSYWERSGSLSERADELTAALDKGTPLSYINTGGDPVGGYPAAVTDYRTAWQKFSDELPYIAYDYIPLLVLIALYVLALLIRPFAVRLLRRFGENRQ